MLGEELKVAFTTMDFDENFSHISVLQTIGFKIFPSERTHPKLLAPFFDKVEEKANHNLKPKTI